MKKFLSIIFTLIAVFVISSNSSAQYIVKKSDDASVNTTANGFYYSLPKTLFKIRITVETIEKIKGPLADYTTQYLGNVKHIDKNSAFSHVVNVDVQPVTIADPNQTYWVQFPIENPKEKDKTVSNENFVLSNLGTLLAYDNIQPVKETYRETVKNNVFYLSDNNDLFDKQASYNRRIKIDTVIRKITIDTVTINRFLFKTSWVDINEEQKADDAAKQITKIRKARYNLLTGYQEVNYGESIKYMDKQLQNLEHQYLELFLGKEIKSIKTYSFIFSPAKKHTGEALMSFTTQTGVTKTLNVKVVNIQNVNGLNKQAGSKINNIYYRIPVAATLEVNIGSQNLYKDIFQIPQLGYISSVPLKNNKLQFDFVTGTLIKIKKD